MRVRVVILLAVVGALLILFLWQLRRTHQTKNASAPAPSIQPSEASGGSSASQQANNTPATAPTNVYAHNLLLRKGPNFRFYVRWLKGQMARAHQNVNPSFDDPESFFIDIKTGVLRANIGDIGNFLNSGTVNTAPLKNISLAGNGDQITIKAILQKVVPLPIEVKGTLSVATENRIQLHVNKLSVLKIPMKGILGGFHVTISDLFHSEKVPGVDVSDNDIFFDTQKLLPPPHIRGHLTKIRIANPDLEEVFGNAEKDANRVEQWRNFLRLRDGTIDFGKLTMRHVDLVMIDLSKDAWFDLDLNHYQDQLVNGYTRMTPQAGLQIFMPDLREIVPKKNQNISVEWMRNRNIPPPPDVTPN